MSSWVVEGEEQGDRLGCFIQRKLLASCSAREVKRLLEANGCKVNGVIERFASRRLVKGQRVEWLTPQQTPPQAVCEAAILFEDESFILCDKPPHMNCDEEGVLSLFPAATLVHRLDRETSGLLLLAKERQAALSFQEQFKDRTIQKTYLALVDGVPKERKGEHTCYIGRQEGRDGYPRWALVGPRLGKRAEMRWEREKHGNGAALLRCYPHSGRTHQIRLQLQGMGHPILGDYRYTQRFKSEYLPKRTLLHAYELTFSHPMTKKSMHFVAPIPKDFKETIKSFR